MIQRFTLLFMLLGAAACGQIPVDRLLSEGKALKAKIWWAPLAADPVIRPTFEGNYLIEVKSI